MPVAWYPTRWWDWKIQMMRKKIEPFLSSNNIFLATVNISDSVLKLA